MGAALTAGLDFESLTVSSWLGLRGGDPQVRAITLTVEKSGTAGGEHLYCPLPVLTGSVDATQM
jgi:hypothetical protein